MGCGQSAEDRARINELSKDVAAKKTQIDELKVNLDKSMANAKEEESMENQLQTVSREKQTLESQLADLARQKDSLDAAIQALNQQIASIQAQLSAEVKEKTDLAASVADLNAQITALSSERTDLSTRNSQLEGELREAQNKHSAVETALEALNKEKDALMDRISHLGAKIPSILGEHEGHKARDCLQMSPNAHIGVTGLYYCGKIMKGENILCGPLNGNNCKHCQKLDIKSRDLPKGFLMNGEGRICRHGSSGRDWYCGGGVLRDFQGSYEFCGPTNGPNCYFCQEMVALADRRYRKLL